MDIVEYQITKVESPTHYFARLLATKSNNMSGTVMTLKDFSLTYASLTAALEATKVTELKAVDFEQVVAKGAACDSSALSLIYLIMDNEKKFKRVRLAAGMSASSSSGSGQKVTVFLVDDGELMSFHKASVQFYGLPGRLSLARYPRHALEVVLPGVIPTGEWFFSGIFKRSLL